MDDVDIRDLIVRSRSTILEIIENRGYNVESYKGISPVEIDKFSTTNTSLLRIIADKIPEGFAPMKRLVVLYWLDPVKNKLEAELKKLLDEESYFNYKEDEFIILLSEPPHDAFSLQAAKQWTIMKARINFFHLKQIISNPSTHVMVPPHRKLSDEECQLVMKKLKLKSKMELPHIKYHDMQSRVLGLVPGDIVEIRRPSETVGEYTLFRVCAV